MAALAGVLLLSAAQDPALSRNVAQRLSLLADGAATTKPRDGSKPSAGSGASPLAGLQGWIEARLSGLEQLPAKPADRSELHAQT